MKSFLWRHKIIVVLLVIFMLFVGKTVLFPSGDTNGTGSSKKRETKHVVKKETLKETLTLSGKIEAEEHATLRFQTSGRLSWVGVKEGDKVNKYQTLASLDQRDVRKNLEKKLNTYMSERWDFEQLKDDNKDNIITDELKRILEKSQFNLNSSVLDVELQNLSVEYAGLWTPISGVVTKVGSPFAGVNITPAQAEFEVVNPLSVYLSVLADQTEVTKLKQGMKADILLDAFPDEKLTGDIYAVAFTPKTDESGTVYEAKLRLPVTNTDYRYRIDMTADATFLLREKENVLAAPSVYIKRDGDTRYVFTVSGGKRVKTTIRTGDEFDNQTEILSGLKENDVIYD